MTERFNVSGAMLVSLYGKPESESTLFRSRARRVADMGIELAMLNRLFFISLTSVASVATAFAYGLEDTLLSPDLSLWELCWRLLRSWLVSTAR